MTATTETSRQLNIFTIVLQGMPWIEFHYNQLRYVSHPWEWTIVHGIAEPKNDTAWCQGIASCEDDGTLEYIRKLADQDSRIRVIEDDFWPGKVAMCNMALQTFEKPGLLLQMDADEVWTTRQFQMMPAVFEMYPDADCAFFLARVWVGPNRFVCTPGKWANRDYEWLRLWKWQPGRLFESHEPPKLAGQYIVVQKTHTAMLGLVFDHYSYVHLNQIEFKERYYGPKWSVQAWRNLQTMRGPVELSAVLPFVDNQVMSFEA